MMKRSQSEKLLFLLMVPPYFYAKCIEVWHRLPCEKHADPEVYKDGRKQKYKDALGLWQIVDAAASWSHGAC